MVDLTVQSRTQRGSGSQIPPAGQPVAEGQDSYWLFLKQTGGTLFITLAIALAWLLQALPLPTSIMLPLGLVLGVLFFLAGGILLYSQLSGGKSLLGGGLAFLFLSLTGLLFSRGTPLFGATASRPFLSFIFCLVVLIFFAVLAQRVRSRSIGIVVALFSLYLLHSALPHLSGTYQLAAPLSLSLFLSLWLWLWLEKDQDHLLSLTLAGMSCFLWIYAVHFGKQIPDTLWLPSLIGVWLIVVAGVLFRTRSQVQSATSAIRLFIVSALSFAISAGVILLPSPSFIETCLPAFALILTAFPSFYLLRKHPQHLRFRALFGGQILLALAIGLFLSWQAETRLILLASLCLGPALTAWHYQHRSFRIMEHVMLGGLFALSFFLRSSSSFILIGPVMMTRSWAVLLGASLLCIVFSRLHYSWAGKAEVESLQQRAQHLLSLSHALTAALLLAFHLILHREDSGALPWLLLWQGVFFFGMSLLLATPALTRSALISLLMAHSCYYAAPLIFMQYGQPLLPLPGAQVWILLAFTLVVALGADSSSRRMHAGESILAESMVFALPYLMSLLLAARLFLYKPSPGELLFFISLSGWFFFCLSENRCLPLNAMKAVALFLMITAVLLSLLRLFGLEASLYQRPEALPALLLLLVNSVPLERLLRRHWRPESFLSRLIPSLLSPFLLLLALVVLLRWHSGPWLLGALACLTLYFFSLSLLTSSRSRYYTALLSLLFCLGGAFFYVLGQAYQMITR